MSKIPTPGHSGQGKNDPAIPARSSTMRDRDRKIAEAAARFVETEGDRFLARALDANGTHRTLQEERGRVLHVVADEMRRHFAKHPPEADDAARDAFAEEFRKAVASGLRDPLTPSVWRAYQAWATATEAAQDHNAPAGYAVAHPNAMIRYLAQRWPHDDEFAALLRAYLDGDGPCLVPTSSGTDAAEAAAEERGDA